MRNSSPFLALRSKVISTPLFIPLFTTLTVIAAAWASPQVSEPTKRYWQKELQQQVSTLTDDTGFTVDLHAAEWIANDYAIPE
jgi:hypothetical protein